MPPLSGGCTPFEKVKSLLARRASYGSFQRLELIWYDNALGEHAERLLLARNGVFPSSLDQNVVIHPEAYFSWLLDDLRLVNEEGMCKYERVISFRTSKELSDDVRLVAKEVHFAFGGRLYWGDELTWDNYEKVEKTSR